MKPPFLSGTSKFKDRRNPRSSTDTRAVLQTPGQGPAGHWKSCRPSAQGIRRGSRREDHPSRLKVSSHAIVFNISYFLKKKECRLCVKLLFGNLHLIVLFLLGLDAGRGCSSPTGEQQVCDD